MPEHPNHKIRVANSVMILMKRLDSLERAETIDAMELIGVWDELSRVDRKWREQTVRGSDRRDRERDEPKLASWFERLIRQLNRALREPNLPEIEKSALERAKQASLSRQPLPET